MAKNLLQNAVDTAGLIRISKQVVSGVTTIPFTGLANFPFTLFRLVSSLTTANAVFGIQISSNNGSTYISTGYNSGMNIMDISQAGTTWSNLSTSSTNMQIMQAGGLSSGNNLAVTEITGMNQASVFPSHITNFTLVNSANIDFGLSVGSYPTAINANALQLIATTGTLTGTFILYGYA